jgi:hypothetical protein
MLNEMRQVAAEIATAVAVSKIQLIEDIGVGCFPSFQAMGSG